MQYARKTSNCDTHERGQWVPAFHVPHVTCNRAVMSSSYVLCFIVEKLKSHVIIIGHHRFSRVLCFLSARRTHFFLPTTIYNSRKNFFHHDMKGRRRQKLCVRNWRKKCVSNRTEKHLGVSFVWKLFASDVGERRKTFKSDIEADPNSPLAETAQHITLQPHRDQFHVKTGENFSIMVRICRWGGWSFFAVVVVARNKFYAEDPCFLHSTATHTLFHGYAKY